MRLDTRTNGRQLFVRLSIRAAILTRGIVIATTPTLGALALLTATHLAQREQEPVDVVVVGAGIAGLSAALEAARAGASVLVVDMSTVGGGHAILSNGAVSLIGTPLQERQKIADSPTLAEKDFLARGEDNDTRWVAAYVRDSREWLYDWLADLGVSFESLVRPPGNSVPRLHLATRQRAGTGRTDLSRLPLPPERAISVGDPGRGSGYAQRPGQWYQGARSPSRGAPGISCA